MTKECDPLEFCIKRKEQNFYFLVRNIIILASSEHFFFLEQLCNLKQKEIEERNLECKKSNSVELYIKLRVTA